MKSQPIIDLGNEKPGILSLFAYDPKAGAILNQLAQYALREADSNLTIAEREFIAAYVSKLNGTDFCEQSHTSFCKAAGDVDPTIDEFFSRSLDISRLTTRQNIIIGLIQSVINRENNKGDDFFMLHTLKHPNFTEETGLEAKDIHLIVLIVSAFCMYNTYVTGMGVSKEQMTGEESQEVAEQIVEKGYFMSNADTEEYEASEARILNDTSVSPRL